MILCAFSLNISSDPLLCLRSWHHITACCVLSHFLFPPQIRTELLANLILSFLGLAVLTAHSFVHLLIDDHSEESVLYKLYEYMVLSVVICTIYFAICYVMTLYIILQPEAQCQTQSVCPESNEPKESKLPKDAPQSVPDIASKMANHSYSVHNLPRSPSQRDITADGVQSKVDMSSVRMHHIFRNEHAFKLFIRHLAKEYSVENALFLFESQQFKRHFSRIQGDLSIVIPTMAMHPALENRGTNSISISTSKRGLLTNKRPKQRISGLVPFCCLVMSRVLDSGSKRGAMMLDAGNSEVNKIRKRFRYQNPQRSSTL